MEIRHGFSLSTLQSILSDLVIEEKKPANWYLTLVHFLSETMQKISITPILGRGSDLRILFPILRP